MSFSGDLLRPALQIQQIILLILRVIVVILLQLLQRDLIMFAVDLTVLISSSLR